MTDVAPPAAVRVWDLPVRVFHWTLTLQWIVIGLVLLHVSAVLFYLLARRLDLIRPMWHGDKRLADASLAAIDDAAMRWRALALLGLSVVSLG